MAEERITITLYENQLVTIIEMLENHNAPLVVTKPIHDAIIKQIGEQRVGQPTSQHPTTNDKQLTIGSPFNRGRRL